MHWQRLSSKFHGKKFKIHNRNPRDATCILLPKHWDPWEYRCKVFELKGLEMGRA